MATEKDLRLFDIRVVERNIEKGLISRKEYDAYLAGLDDLEAQTQPFEAEFVEGVLDQDD